MIAMFYILIFTISFINPIEDKTESHEDIELKYLLGKVNAEKDSNFVRIDYKYCNKKAFMEKEAYKAFEDMYAAAKKDGIELKIISAFRSFNYQKWLWERKWTGAAKVNGKDLSKSIPDKNKRALEILKYSSMPGTSRHHWGTDIDIYSLTNSDFETGKGLEIYNWLSKNASKYGFYKAYTEFGENRKSGYLEEKWHWSYKPKSANYLKNYIEKVNYKHLSGFQGADIAENLNIIEKYVLGVNSELKI